MSDEAPVTSFNLKNLPNSLKPVATVVCSEVVWGMAVSRPRPRLLVVDECWTVLATPSGVLYHLLGSGVHQIRVAGRKFRNRAMASQNRSDASNGRNAGHGDNGQTGGNGEGGGILASAWRVPFA